jgi:Arc/MetJ-type ribon-helix-helix transcriptional regulator
LSSRGSGPAGGPGLKKKPIWYIKSSMDKEFTTVSIPTSLYKKIEESIKGTEYRSVSSYIAKVVRETLFKAELATEAFSKDEEDKVKERLKALGYID